VPVGSAGEVEGVVAVEVDVLMRERGDVLDLAGGDQLAGAADGEFTSENQCSVKDGRPAVAVHRPGFARRLAERSWSIGPAATSQERKRGATVPLRRMNSQLGRPRSRTPAIRPTRQRRHRWSWHLFAHGCLSARACWCASHEHEQARPARTRGRRPRTRVHGRAE